MSTDVDCSEPEILKSFREVQNEKSSTIWAIYGYVPKTNKLKVDATGSGDMEELKEELSDGKVQYAVYRVQDEKSSLGKVVFINWVGEGVAEARKGMTSSHVTKIANHLKGFHVQINARSEADLDLQTIKEKVSKAAGAYYTAHKEGKEGQSKSVGGEYKPVGQTQKDTSVRADTSGIKQRLENIKTSNEQAPPTKQVPKPVGKLNTPTFQQGTTTTEPPKPTAPKPVGKFNSPTTTTTTPTPEPPKPIAPKFTPKMPEPVPEPEPVPVLTKEPEQDFQDNKDQQYQNDELLQQQQQQQGGDEWQQTTNDNNNNNNNNTTTNTGGEIYTARALYDFDAQDDTELGFKEGDIIKVLNQIDDAWYEGEKDGKIGMFPVEYVEIVN